MQIRIEFIFRAVFLVSTMLSFLVKGHSQSSLTWNDGDNTNIARGVMIMEDETGEYTIADVLNRIDNKDYELYGDGIISYPSSPSTYWITFYFENSMESNYQVSVLNYNLNYLSLYQIKDDEVIKDKVTGALESTDSIKSIIGVYSMEIIPNEGKNLVVLKVRTCNLIEVPILFGPKVAIEKEIKHRDYITLLLVGCLIVLLVYNFSLWLVVKENVYFMYCIFLIGSFITFSFLSSLPVVELIFGKTIAYKYSLTWLGAAISVDGLFAISYFKLKKTSRLFYKIIIGFVFVLIGFGALNLFIPGEYLSNIFQLVIILMYVVFVFMLIGLARKKEPNSLLFTIGWSMMLISVVLYILATNGILPMNFITKHLLFFSFFAESVLFSLALAQKVYKLKIEHEALNINLIKSNKELELSNESLDSFNYHVSHDLKSILNNTTSLAKMIDKYLKKENYDKVSEANRRLIRVSESGTETVQSFLSIGMLKSDELQSAPQYIEFERELNDILVTHGLQDKIDVEIGNVNNTKLQIHIKSFESIFLNFLTNSIKYCTKNPKAVISLKEDGEFFVISYSDNGIGIDLANEGDVLFQPFKRLKNDLKQEGTGVGLYLVKRLVENYKGTIAVKSELGVGTEFIIHLPIFSKKQL